MVCVRGLGPWVSSAFPLGRGRRLPVQPWAGSGRVKGTERGCLGTTFSWASQTCYSSDLKCLWDHMPQAWQQLVALVMVVETLGGAGLVGGSRSSGKGPFTVSLASASLSLYFLIPFPYLSSPCLHFCPSSPSFLHLPQLSHLSLRLVPQEMGSFFFFQSVFAVRMLRVRCQDAPPLQHPKLIAISTLDWNVWNSILPPLR